MKMKISKEQALKFIDEAILRTINAKCFEELEKQSANARGYVFGLEMCGFLDNENLEEKYTNEFWEEKNRIAYKKGLDNVFMLINKKNNT